MIKIREYLGLGSALVLLIDIWKLEPMFLIAMGALAINVLFGKDTLMLFLRFGHTSVPWLMCTSDILEKNNWCSTSVMVHWCSFFCNSTPVLIFGVGVPVLHDPCELLFFWPKKHRFFSFCISALVLRFGEGASMIIYGEEHQCLVLLCSEIVNF